MGLVFSQTTFGGNMATDAYLKIDGINGESADAAQ